MESLDYLVIGHLTRDLLPDGGSSLGGTVTYSGRAASALGFRTAVITSTGPEVDLRAAFPGIQVKRVPAKQTTTFENRYKGEVRTQFVTDIAAPISDADIPAGWERARVVHLAPLVDELSPELIYRFSNSLVGLTPQGWMRAWDEAGAVSAINWSLAERYCHLAAAVILSEADLPDVETLEFMRRSSPLLVMTRGSAGCVVFMGDEKRSIPTDHVQAAELTGAGDIFATAFLLRLYQTRGNPWEAARFATTVATQSVTGANLTEKIRLLKQLRQQDLQVSVSHE